MSKHFIVIPLYDHTPDSEVDEILLDLDRLGFSSKPYQVRGIEAPADTTQYTSTAISYDQPEWNLLDEHQTIRCGKRGVRREQDTRHAAWIRREARKRGLVANVSLANGVAHVRLTKVSA